MDPFDFAWKRRWMRWAEACALLRFSTGWLRPLVSPCRCNAWRERPCSSVRSANLATEQVFRPSGSTLFRSCLIQHGYRGPHHGLHGGLFWNPQARFIGVLAPQPFGLADQLRSFHQPVRENRQVPQRIWPSIGLNQSCYAPANCHRGAAAHRSSADR